VLGRKLRRRFRDIWPESGVGSGREGKGLGWSFFFICLFYIISCFVCLIRNFVCLIRCFKKTTFSLFNLLIGYLLLIRWQIRWQCE
jgi:hypothetical protein